MGRILGIEIGYSLIRICETDFKSKNPKVYKTIQLITPGNVVEDGMLTVTDGLVSVIREALKNNRVRTKQAVFSVSSTKIASREVLIPEIKENKIRDLVETNAPDYFPMDISQYRLSYSILDTLELDSGGKKLKLLVLATPNQMMDRYKELASKCGLQAVAIDYCGNSIYQMVKKECESDVEMIIKVDERIAFLIILKNGKVIMQRTVAYGIDEAVEVLLSKNSIWSYTDAIDELRTRELLLESMEENGFGGEWELKQEITGALEYLIRGINRVLDYYNSKNPQDTVKHIFVTGLGGDIVNFPRLLTSELGIRAEVFTGADGTAVARYFSVAGRLFGTFAACIGAAAAPVWPVAEPKRRSVDTAEKNAGTNLDKISAVVLALGTVLAIFFTVFSVVSKVILQKQQEELNARIEQLKPAETVYEKYNYIKTLRSDADRIAESARNSNDSLKAFIEEMEERMPSDITVVTMTATAEAVTMSIDVQTKAEAAAIVSGLRKFSSVGAVETSGMTDSVDETGYHKINFTVNCVYRTEPAGEAGGESK